MTIFLWTLGGLFALTLIVYAVIPLVRWVRSIGQLNDGAEEIYPGDRARQAELREEVASRILRDNPGLDHRSPEFRALYHEEMDRLVEEHFGPETS